MRFIRQFVSLWLCLRLWVFIPHFVQFGPLLRNQRFQSILLLFVVSSQCLALLFAVFCDLLHFSFFIALHLPDLAFQLVHFLLFLFCVFGSVFSQFQQLLLAVGFGFIQWLYFHLQFFDQSGVRFVLFCSSRQCLLHYYFVIWKCFVDVPNLHIRRRVHLETFQNLDVFRVFLHCAN